MYQALFPWVRRRADRFIAVSRYTADDLVRRAGIAASKMDVVYHGLDPAFRRPVMNESAASVTPYFLAVGESLPGKTPGG